jgi:hypothetical protein
MNNRALWRVLKTLGRSQNEDEYVGDLRPWVQSALCWSTLNVLISHLTLLELTHSTPDLSRQYRLGSIFSKTNVSQKLM